MYARDGANRSKRYAFCGYRCEEVAHPRGEIATALTCVLQGFCQLILIAARRLYDQLYDRRWFAGRKTYARHHIEYAIEAILKDVWKGDCYQSELWFSIHRRANWHSPNPRYRDPNLTYKQAIAALDGMVRLRLVEVTKDDRFDHFTGSGLICQ